MASDVPSRARGPLRQRVTTAVEFLSRNRRTLVVDAVVIVAWVSLLGLTFSVTGWPLLAYYVSLVVGIVAYTLAREPLAFGDK